MKVRIVQPLRTVTLIVVGLAVISPVAHASFIIDSLVGGSPPGVSYANFDNLPLGAAGGTSGRITVSFTGSSAAVTGTTGSYAAPYLSNQNGTAFGDPNDGPDTTVYLATLGTVVLSLPGPEMYFGLLWGSVDADNTLTFYSGGVNGTMVGSITGTDVTNSADGDQGANGTFYVNINSTLSFDTVVASNGVYAFEFDNVAYNPTNVNLSTVPEPSTIISASIACLMGLAFACNRRGRTPPVS